jgi:hypothetical protein
MITNSSLLRKFEDDLSRNEAVISPDNALNMLTMMWQEGVALGVLPYKDKWEGLDVDVRVARVLNSCLLKSSPK